MSINRVVGRGEAAQTHSGALHSRSRERDCAIHSSMDGLKSIMLGKACQRGRDKHHVVCGV